MEYRRVGNGGGFPATFDDVAAAIDLLADADVDTSTVVTLGHSAGGHLATWAAARTRFDEWSGGIEVTHVISPGRRPRPDRGAGAGTRAAARSTP